jgi:GNAT superfamily N-acetyltransferase
VELMGHWFEVMDAYKEKHIDTEKDYCKFSSFATCKLKLKKAVFHVIGTHPEYFRMGLGSKLLERFLQDADRDHARVYLQATEMGTKMYPGYGFKDIEEMTVNTPRGPVNWRCMMREAQSTKA